jgi:hypothetical protein
VELDGRTLRAHHAYTGRVLERPLEEVERVVTLVSRVKGGPAAGTVAVAVTDAMLGRVRGVEIRFRDRRTPIQIRRRDPAMTNARELVEAVLGHMAEIGKIHVETTNHQGRPLVEQIYWEGESKKVRSSQAALIVGCFAFVALIIGFPLAFVAQQEETRRAVTSTPPHEITLARLIADGPGANRHVTVTNLQFGGYVTQERHGNWESVTVALFPAGAKGAREIKAVLDSSAIRDKDALERFFQRDKITGICGASPSGLGSALGPKLQEVNGGATVTTAWRIEDASNVGSAGKVQALFLAASGLLAVAMALALTLVYLKR